MVNGAKMGQTVRQTMPFNAHYAFVQAGENARYGQQTRASPAQTATYPSTIGVWSTITKHECGLRNLCCTILVESEFFSPFRATGHEQSQ